MVKKILVVGPNWLGDVVMALPAVQEKRRREGVEVAVMARPGVAGVWRMGLGEGAEIVEHAKGGSWRELARRLRATGAEETYVMPHSFRAALGPWLARMPRRIGLKGHFARDWMLDEVRRADVREGRRHQAWEMLDLLLGTGVATEIPPPRLEPGAALRAAARELLGGGRGDGTRRVVMIPGAARGPSKQWPEEYYAAAGRALAERGMRTFLAGTAGERALCERIAAVIGPTAEVLAGRTGLGELTAVLAEADGVLCNDSGGMHLAAAAGTPTVACFGITNPEQTGPLGAAGTVRVLQHSARRTRDVPRVSPEAEAALRAVTPEEAVAALEGTLRAVERLKS